MQGTQTSQVKPTPQSGNGQSQAQVKSTPDTPPPVKPTIRGRIFETVAAAFFAGCFVVFGWNLERWLYVVFLIILFFALALGFRRLAISQAEKAADDEDGRKKQRQYKVTWRRLRILEKVGVPDDVIAALTVLLGEGPMPEEKFFNRIATDPNTDLGIDRTNEFRDTIARYTVEVSPASRSASS